MKFSNNFLAIILLSTALTINTDSVQAMTVSQNYKTVRVIKRVKARLEEIKDYCGEAFAKVTQRIIELVEKKSPTDEDKSEVITLITKTKVYGTNLLLKAIDWDNVIMVDFFLHYIKIPKDLLIYLLLQRDAHGYTALHYAAKNGNLQIVQEIVNLITPNEKLVSLLTAQVQTPEGEEDDYKGLTAAQIASKRLQSAKISQTWVQNDINEGKDYKSIAEYLK